MTMQNTQHILMIRPVRFISNPQTQSSNAFQRTDITFVSPEVAAMNEFDAYVAKLRAAGMDVTVIDDTPLPHTPDSIFPNNWVSFHENGTVVLYPMQAENRRQERRQDILAQIGKRFDVRQVLDLSRFELDGKYHEGTGVMVLDHVHKIAYVCRASRSHPEVMAAFSAHLGYQAFWFDAVDSAGRPIYHTNVMMGVGRTLAVVCLESIHDLAQRQQLVQKLTDSGKVILPISYTQMNAFAGNVMELQNPAGEAVLAMSTQAWDALSDEQQQLVRQHTIPVTADLHTIETLGGGGARCMIAEIFLPLKTAADNDHAFSPVMATHH